MTAWTVQCHYAAYYARTETVEAETLEDACARAVAQANASDLWTALDHHCGPTFVAAVAEGEGADPWGPEALPVPGRCTEAGEPPLVVVTGPAPAGGVRVAQGRARIRFVRGRTPSPPTSTTARRRTTASPWSASCAAPTAHRT